jgi:hypothetical protein
MSGGRVPAFAATVPMCAQCNQDFGRELEGPVQKIFDDLESGAGLTDAEAELLIRWLWKFEGLAWCFSNPDGVYSERYTLRDRVLSPIDEIRGNLILCVSLIRQIDSSFGDAPMGIDSMNKTNAIFVAAVFSGVALIAAHIAAETEIPSEYSCYRLSSSPGPSTSKVFHPQVGFESCVDAVVQSRRVSPHLSYLHDRGVGHGI